MNNVISLLFELVRETFPYQSSSEAEIFYSQQAEQLYLQFLEQYPNAKHDLWVFKDSLENFYYFQSMHYFTLGLDFGMSINRETSALYEV